MPTYTQKKKRQKIYKYEGIYGCSLRLWTVYPLVVIVPLRLYFSQIPTLPDETCTDFKFQRISFVCCKRNTFEYHWHLYIYIYKYRLQVVRMFIAVVTIFAICWLPYHMFYVYAYHQPRITSTSSTPHLFLAFYWLAMSNSMVNPIIYYWMNRRFRHYFQQILCFCCFRLWKVDDTFLQRNNMSIERKPRLCKYFLFYLIPIVVSTVLYSILFSTQILKRIFGGFCQCCNAIPRCPLQFCDCILLWCDT